VTPSEPPERESTDADEIPDEAFLRMPGPGSEPIRAAAVEQRGLSETRSSATLVA
jgi:hypothetical protein